MTPALLDRLISVTSGPPAFAKAQRLSELADAPYVVLLGAPGMGKSVALQQFADRQHTRSVQAFRFRPDDLEAETTVFIDALDEISSANAVAIADALERKRTVRWRVSCRAQDWTEGSKLGQAFGKGMAAVEIEPVVAQLLPLTVDEATAVLKALKCQDPDRLLASITSQRSSPFALSPLGLQFLMGMKPECLPELTRFDLYESGAVHFATEHNINRAEDNRTSISPTEAIDQAGRVFLTLLLCGKHGLQRSGAIGEGLLSVHDAGVKASDMNSILDTALFWRNDSVFLPFHRSIQEFLAGRYLARAVTGSSGGIRLHFKRALALLVAADGIPADNLKALYAWFACHLAKEGAPDLATQLVLRDPDTVLLHGDPATLPLDARIELLRSTGSRAPYFRWEEGLGRPAPFSSVGLITADIIPLASKLLEGEKSTHRLSMLLEAFSTGPAIHSCAEICWNVALEQSDVPWCREQAIMAWLHNGSPSIQELWKRIAGIPQMADIKPGHMRTLSQLFTSIPVEQIRLEHVYNVINHLGDAYTQLSINHRLPSSIHVLNHAVRTIARHIAAGMWRPLITLEAKRWQIKSGVGSVEHNFASALCSTAISQEHVSLEDFAAMLVATGLITGSFTHFQRPALEWLASNHNPDNVLPSLLQVMDQEIADCGALALGLLALDLRPSEVGVRLMITSSSLIRNVDPEYIGRQIAHWILAQEETVPAWLWPILEQTPGEITETISQNLASHAMRTVELATAHPLSPDSVVAHQIAEWQRKLTAVASGEIEEALYYGAEVYAGHSLQSAQGQSGSEALCDVFGVPLAEAIIDGHLSRWPVMGEDTNTVVLAAAASMRQAADLGLSDLDAKGILAILHAAFSIQNVTNQKFLESYCLDELNLLFTKDPNSLNEVACEGGSEWFALLVKLGEHLAWSATHTWACTIALQRPELLEGPTLASVLTIADLNLTNTEIKAVLGHVLIKLQDLGGAAALAPGDMLRWTYFAVCVDLEAYQHDFLDALQAADSFDICTVITDSLQHSFYSANEEDKISISFLILKHLTLRQPTVDRFFDIGSPDIIKILNLLSSFSSASAEHRLLELLELNKGTCWADPIRHDLEVYRRDRRNRTQISYTPADLTKVLTLKGPVSPADLRAIVELVLEEISIELQPSALNPWKLFWEVQKPKTENDCRDVLAGKLKDRLSLYGNIDVRPEEASSGGTRADLIVEHGQFSVPIEAKRTSHSHLWFGHSGQLQTYNQGRHSEQQGIYIVFWFGDALPLTAAPDGRRPATPEELKHALVAVLPSNLAENTSVFVLDVTDAGKSARERKNAHLKQTATRGRKPKPL